MQLLWHPKEFTSYTIVQCNDILKYNFIMTGKCHDIKVFYICIFSAYTATHVKLPGVLTHVAPF